MWLPFHNLEALSQLLTSLLEYPNWSRFLILVQKLQSEAVYWPCIITVETSTASQNNQFRTFFSPRAWQFSGALEGSTGAAPRCLLYCLDLVLPAVSSGADIAALCLSSCSPGKVVLQSERTPRLLAELPGGLTGGGHKDFSSATQE